LEKIDKKKPANAQIALQAFSFITI
jgi:hypothetical protein